MRRHAKASTAGSTEASGRRRLWGLFTTLALVLCVLGSGASSASAAAPTTVMGTVSNVLSGSAHVTGEVNTGGNSAQDFALYSFEYSTDEVNWTKVNEEGVFSGAYPVSFDITGLKGATKYFVRLSATNFSAPEAFSPGPNPEFETLPADPPAVLSIDDASPVGATIAKVSGEVERPAPANSDPGFDLQCNFEYIDDVQFLATGFTGATRAACNNNPDPVTAADPPQVSTDLTELTPGTTYHLRLAVSNAGGTDSKVAANTFTTLMVPKPTVLLNPIVNLTANSATFSAKINPGAASSDPGFKVNWHFECQPACLSLSEEGGSFADDGVEHEVKTDATLEPNTAYTIKIVAENAGGTESDEASFNTEAIAPTVQTMPAFVLEGGHNALVGGTINPNNSPTKYWIEYGTTAAYGTSIPATQDASAGSGIQAQFRTQELSGLALGTTYHFRVSVKNDQGEVHGEDLTFTTLPPVGPPTSCSNAAFRTGPSANLPDCRAYENLTPMNLLGSKATGAGAVAENGEAALWRTTANLPGVDATGVSDAYMAKRTSSGWTSTLVSPPGSMAPGSASTLLFTSPSLDRMIWSTVGALNPEDPDGEDPNAFFQNQDLYRREPDGSFTWLTRGSDVGPPAGFPNFGSGGATVDALKVFFYQDRQYEPDAPSGGLYIRSGQTTTVIKDENGVPITANPSVTGISADGSVVTVRNANAAYVYEQNLRHAVRVVDATDSNGSPNGFNSIALSSDGSKFLFATSESLTPDDEDSASDIYEYEVGSGNFRRVSGTSAGPGPGNGEADVKPVLASPDGSSVYFTSTEQLDGSKGVSGVPNLYLAQGGAIHYAMTLTGGELQKPRLTRDGGKLLFESSDRLTAYDNDGHTEIYAYDSNDDGVVCASCRPSGEVPSGNAGFGDKWSADQHGERIFFQSTDAVLPQDANGKDDVYEFTASSDTTSLISTGQSPNPSLLAGNGADGGDVFFFSVESLRPNDQNIGVPKLFDARIGGGFAEPPPPAVCEGEGCRGSGSAKPADAAPATPSFSGPGNPKPKPKHAKHRKHKKHGKHKSKSHKRAANSNGRNGR